MNSIAGDMSELAVPTDPLVLRCRAGDIDALAEVYSHWERAIYRHAFWMLGDADDADDVKQETFLRAFRSFSSFDARCALNTWLFGICSNLCRDRLNQRKRRLQVSFDLACTSRSAEGLSGDPERILIDREDHEIVFKALLSLPESHREVLLLREVEGLNYDEIREVLGCSLASVKLRLFRAREQWRKRYDGLHREGDLR